jgi:hypothetical protein
VELQLTLLAFLKTAALGFAAGVSIILLVGSRIPARKSASIVAQGPRSQHPQR